MTYRRYDLKHLAAFRDGGDKVRQKQRREFERIGSFFVTARDNVLKYVFVADRGALRAAQSLKRM